MRVAIVRACLLGVVILTAGCTNALANPGSAPAATAPGTPQTQGTAGPARAGPESPPPTTNTADGASGPEASPPQYPTVQPPSPAPNQPGPNDDKSRSHETHDSRSAGTSSGPSDDSKPPNISADTPPRTAEPIRPSAGAAPSAPPLRNGTSDAARTSVPAAPPAKPTTAPPITAPPAPSTVQDPPTVTSAPAPSAAPVAPNPAPPPNPPVEPSAPLTQPPQAAPVAPAQPGLIDKLMPNGPPGPTILYCIKHPNSSVCTGSTQNTGGTP